MNRTWSKLLSDARPYMRAGRKGPDERSEFERDYDRLIYASPFRRLQDKAQVFPLEHNDFVRTRLTHSLEVSTLGRSLGRQVGRRLKEERGIDVSSDDIGTLVATTCLAHDIGNPPFGHSGEDAIRRWFQRHPETLAELEPAQREDFLQFDGNAQGLRILTFLQSLGYDNGLNLTYTTLASFMKYVCDSQGIDKRSKIRKKIGYFQSEKRKVERMREALELGPHRHPLAFLMEAADDIAYSVVDIEDGLKKKVLRHDRLITLLREKLQETPVASLVEKLDRDCGKVNVGQAPGEQVNNAFAWFRITAIGIMFQGAVEAFLNHHDEILSGEFEQELIRVSGDGRVLRDALVEIAGAEVYCAKEVLELEVFGDKVISELLSRFVPACLSADYKELRRLDGKIYALISPSMRALQETFTRMTPYDRIQLAVDHVCGMTDTYAVAVYEKLNGRM